MVAIVRAAGAAVAEVPMEPENRPYVDPDTKPGDAGTEEWSDSPPGSGGAIGRGPLADAPQATDAEGALEGSPADEFITDPDAIADRDQDAERA